MFEHHLDDQVMDPLHLAELNLPKIAWKHGVLNNASDDARAEISELLKALKHPLDTRRKDNNRIRAQKWFTGERWATFCAGERGSPGGPRAIAAIVLIIAKDLQERGVDRGGDTRKSDEATAATPSTAPVPAKQGGSKLAYLQRVGAKRGNSLPEVPESSKRARNREDATARSEVMHVPSQIELMCNPADLQIIRDLYGSRAQTIINTLLSFDAYFAWYYAFKKSIHLESGTEERERFALKNCQAAVDLHEIYERLSIRGHSSFLLHGAIYKVPRDILNVADLWAHGTSPLELLNADSKRTASSSGARNITYTTNTRNRTTMAVSTLNQLLATQYLRKGDGIISMRDSRRSERLFGQEAIGRLSLASAIKMESPADVYHPKDDTCIAAFVRLLALQSTVDGWEK